MSNPRIAEVDDDDDDVEEVTADDPDEMDLDAFDFARPQGTLGRQAPPANSASTSTPASNPTLLSASNFPQPGAAAAAPPPSDKERQRLAREQAERTKHFQCLYPVYFDAGRSRAQGRRVSRGAAVPNPLAREIVDALQHIGQRQLGLGFQIVFEPNKQHPLDWANPGRVRVLVKEGGVPVSGKLGSKHHLYTLVAAYLRDHPATKDSPMKLRMHGMPPMDGPPPPPAVPRGKKINAILPLHSPALSGGGVSDNMFKDMMAEMQGGLPGGAAGALGGGAAGSEKKVKDKKKK